MLGSMRQAIILALAFSLLLSTCASPSKPVEIGVTPRAFGPEPTVGPPTPTRSNPIAARSDVIGWDMARPHMGQFKTVCGPVVSARYAPSSAGQPTFLNIGKDYPAPDRFTVVIWGRNLANFPFKPEDYYASKTICVSGLIKEYGGVPEIEVSSPSQIEVQVMPTFPLKPTPSN